MKKFATGQQNVRIFWMMIFVKLNVNMVPVEGKFVEISLSVFHMSRCLNVTTIDSIIPLFLQLLFQETANALHV